MIAKFKTRFLSANSCIGSQKWYYAPLQVNSPCIVLRIAEQVIGKLESFLFQVSNMHTSNPNSRMNVIEGVHKLMIIIMKPYKIAGRVITISNAVKTLSL